MLMARLLSRQDSPKNLHLTERMLSGLKVRLRTAESSELCVAANERHVVLVWSGPERSDRGEQQKPYMATPAFGLNFNNRPDMVSVLLPIRIRVWSD